MCAVCLKLSKYAWIEQVIQPCYNFLLLMSSGWFYLGFNKQGYQHLDKQKDNKDEYGLGEDLIIESGSGGIPPIVVKKPNKKLDDRNDIFDEDDFSEGVQIVKMD